MEVEANVLVEGIPGTQSDHEVMENEQNLRLLYLQNEILEKISSIQDSVRNAVINRAWTDFESLLRTMNQYADQFQALETERAALLSSLLEEHGMLPQTGNAKSPSGFYSLVSQFPERDRNSLTEMYRNLKLRALKVRMANESLVTYLNEAKTTINSFLEAACPDRKTRFYSRWGTKVTTDARSMVVNHSL
jgi:hypothetical protein